MIKGLFRRSLLNRILLALLIAFAVLYVVLIAYRVVEIRLDVASGSVRDIMGKSVLASLAAASDAAQARAVGRTADELINGLRRVDGMPGKQFVQIRDRLHGEWVYGAPSTGAPPWSASATGVPHEEAGLSIFFAETPRWSLRMVEPQLPLGWLLETMGEAVPIYLLVSFPVIFLPLWLAVAGGLRPLRRLSEQIARRSDDDLDPVQLKLPYHELVPLVSSLNGLLARLRRKIDREHAFVQNAAHELRTPMAVILAQAHVLAKARDEADRDEAAAQLHQALSRSSHLVEQMLQLATVDQERAGARRRADLVRLARHVLDDLRDSAAHRGVTVVLDAPAALPCHTDLEAWRSIVQNLVGNAIRYGREGGRVVVEMAHVGDTLRLSVVDDGPGIAESERPRIFERFYRGAGHDLPGSGLGLAIVKQAVLRLDGKVSLGTGLAGRGCCFTVEWPVDVGDVPTLT